MHEELVALFPDWGSSSYRAKTYGSVFYAM